ncbi:MAG: methylated-DNA--[protein]-cysteine S-methyltransferase [Tenericutes bacterium]|nr:methylated-DNA--[protein]-cysteine S-methyltransferase [Mycoplasmatota bacterium]
MEKYTFASIIGSITVFYDNNIVSRILVDHEQPSNDKPKYEISRVVNQVNEFLACIRSNFDLPIDIQGSSFKLDILNGILAIPIGKTLSYKELANKCGYPNAYRAVGTICRNNKLPIIIPCHRVIKSNGDIGDYAFGKAIKKQLLDIEKSFIID